MINFFLQKALLATTLNAKLYYHPNKKTRAKSKKGGKDQESINQVNLFF